jgi:hypothetical protein
MVKELALAGIVMTGVNVKQPLDFKKVDWSKWGNDGVSISHVAPKVNKHIHKTKKHHLKVVQVTTCQYPNTCSSLN